MTDFRSNPDNANPSSEFVLNEFRGLNEVSPNGMMGEPTTLLNVWFDRYGGYRPAEVAAYSISGETIARNTTNPTPVGSYHPDVAAYDNKNKVVYKNGAALYFFDALTLAISSVASNAAGLRQYAPEVVLGQGATSSSVNEVFVATNNLVYSIGNPVQLLNPSNPYYALPLFGFVPASRDTLYSTEPDGKEVGGLQLGWAAGTDAGGFALYKPGTRVGWSPQLAFEHYVLIFLVPDQSGTVLNPNQTPPPLYPMLVRWDTQRTLFQSANAVMLHSAGDIILHPGLIQPRLSSYNSSSSAQEVTLKMSNVAAGYKVVAFGAAYPFTRRQHDMVYADGIEGYVRTIDLEPTPFRVQWFRGTATGGHFSFRRTFDELPVVGDTYAVGDYFIGDYILYPNARSIKVTLKCTQAGTVAARTLTEEATLKAAMVNYGSIVTDGALKWQVLTDMASHHRISGGSSPTVTDATEMTFENYIKGTAFPPVAWLGETLPDWFGDLQNIYAEWSELEVVATGVGNQYEVFRNLPETVSYPDLDTPAITPRPGVVEWFQNRAWVAAASVNRINIDQQPRLAVAANAYMPMEFTTETADDLFALFYSDLNKPWRFTGDFEYPVFKSSTRVTSLKTVGNILVIHGDSDACAIYGNSKANFQIQHLQIPGTVSDKTTLVVEGKYYFLADGHLFKLEGTQASSISEGKILLPNTVNINSSLSYNERERIIYVALGNADPTSGVTKTYMYHLFAEAWSEFEAYNTVDARPYTVYNLGKIPVAWTPFSLQASIINNKTYRPMVVNWAGLDMGSARTRKKFNSLFLRFEDAIVTDQVAVSFSTELQPPVGSTITLEKNQYYKRLTMFGKIAAVTVVVTPDLASQLIFRPKMRIEVDRQAESRHEFNL